MNAPSPRSDRLDELIHSYCDGVLKGDALFELQRLLLESDEAKERYLRLVQVEVGMSAWVDQADHRGWDNLPKVEAVSVSRDFHRNWYQYGFYFIAATLLIACTSVIYWGPGLSGNQADRKTPLASSSAVERAKAIGNRADEVSSGRYVARLAGVSEDATWGRSQPEEFLFRLEKGEKLQLETGLAQVQFAAGASVVLHGPSTFEVLAIDAGRLISGRMTGRADNGNFKLITDSAEVLDLGTEFGVAIDASSNTDVCVFDGSVDVKGIDSTAGIERTNAARLFEGMALRIGANGIFDYAAGVDRGAFHRKPVRDSRLNDDSLYVSLVDVLAGGDGRSARLSGAINPRTGDWDDKLKVDPESLRDRYPNPTYASSDRMPLIDGVFIPNHESAPTQIDSSGTTLRLKRNDGKTWGPIWSRRHVPGLLASAGSISDFWGTDTLAGILDLVVESQFGIIGLHANAGITIDLRAVRMQEGRPIAAFKAKITNLDNSEIRAPTYATTNRPSVDFQVIVDGVVRSEQLNFGRDQGRISVEVPLDPNDRFLTLLSTDAGNTFSYDHLVLIDPVLLLKQP